MTSDLSRLNSDAHKNHAYGWWVWFLPALLYLFQYGVQAIPSVTSSFLTTKLTVSSLALSILSSSYYYTYIPMQIIAGIAYDRFKARNILPLALFCFALGIAFFAFSKIFILTVLGRLLIGIGGAFGFVGALYLAGSFLPAAIYPLITGITEFFSAVGILAVSFLFSQVNDAHAAQHWYQFNLGSIIFCILLAMLIWLSMTRPQPSKSSTLLSAQQFRAELRNLLRKSQLWIIAAYVSCAITNLVVLANMWRVPSLVATYKISTQEAVLHNGLVEIGFAIGSFLIGWLGSSFAAKRKQIIVYSALLEFISLTGAHCLEPPVTIKLILLFILGFTTAASLLAFSLVKDFVIEALQGFTAGFVNMATNIIGIILLPITGWLLSITRNNFNLSMMPVIIVTLGTFLLALFIKNQKIPDPGS